MDDRRFDALTKAIGARTSRRSVLRGAIGALVAGLTGSVLREGSARAAVPARPRHCVQVGRPCLAPSTGASRGCCYKCNSSTNTCCETTGYGCAGDTDCCGSLICRDSVVADHLTQRTCFQPGTLPAGAECHAAGECAAGGCAGGRCCTPENATCSSNNQCCGGLVCRGGACRAPGSLGQTCDESTDCAAGLACLNRACCGLSQTACTANSQCCGGLVCRAGVCQQRGSTGQTCDENGDCQSGACDSNRHICCQSAALTCSANSQCCGGLVCRGGACQAAGQPGQVCDEAVDCLSGVCDTARHVCCAPANATCTANSQCCPGAVCRGGICQPIGGQGAVCDEAADCASGLTCQHSVCCAVQNTICTANSQCCSGLVCRGGVCRAPGTIGQTCDENADCAAGTCNSGICCVAASATCSANSQCCNGLVCRGGLCRPLGGSGETCDENADCATGTCNAGVCCSAASAVCTTNSQCCAGLVCRGGACRTPGGLGETCDEAADCSTGGCDGARHVCCRPAAQSCAANSDCCGPLVCRVGICQLAGAQDAICDENPDCLPGFLCESGQCCAATTTTCSSNSDCCSGLTCISGTCRTPSGVGGVCDDAADCAVGTCNSGFCCLPSTSACTANSQCCSGLVCRDGTCQTAGGQDAVCDENADCVSGYLCEGSQCCAADATNCTTNDDCCTGLTCISGACASPSGLGETCNDDDDCNAGTCHSGICCLAEFSSCTENNQCCSGLVCRGSICQEPGGLNDVCDDTSDCASGYLCPGGLCCADESTNCLVNDDCCPGLTCIDGECASPSGLNGDCDDDDDCTIGTCNAGNCCIALFDTCTSNDQCCSGLVCRDGTCQEPGDIGDTCDESADCGGGLICASSTCCVDADDTCTANLECCGEQTCIGGVCADVSGLNGACDAGDNDDCADGYLCESATCCAGSGTVCAIDDDCCTGFGCVDSVCATIQAPTANHDYYTTDTNQAFSVAAADGVLANDTTLSGSLSVTAFDATSSQGGTVSVAADGSFSFTPATNFRGDDTFTYTVTGVGGSSVGHVTIFVSYVQPYLGEIRLAGFNFAPAGWMLCNGQLLSIAQYPDLYALLGTTYGGDGEVNFALPDLRGRVPLHVGGGHDPGERGGEENHTLSIAELPSHAHTVNGTNATADSAAPEGRLPAQATSQIYAAPLNLTPLHGASISATGSNGAHYNMQPYSTVLFYIAVQGVHVAPEPPV